jgi:uncharacterized protein YjiS (DUF1127 family)
MTMQDLQVLADDCREMLSLSDEDLRGLGYEREDVESALAGVIRDMAYLGE